MQENSTMVSEYLSNLFSLKGKTALCTGCTRGIGRSAALTLAKAGANLILVQRDPDNRDTLTKAEILKANAQIVVCDLADPKQTSSLIDKVTNEAKLDFDIVVNCGGIQRRHKSEEFPDDDWNEVLQVNLTASFQICRDAGGFTVPAYAAAKHGIAGITKALSNEWASKNININAIAPGYIQTDMNTALLNDPDRSAQILQRIPAGKWGQPEDFETVMLFLASFSSKYVNGETIVVDGGWMGR